MSKYDKEISSKYHPELREGEIFYTNTRTPADYQGDEFRVGTTAYDSFDRVVPDLYPVFKKTDSSQTSGGIIFIPPDLSSLLDQADGENLPRKDFLE